MAQQRRRGQALEDDILQSTFALLQETAYADITMDMIAAAARTTKSVLYRRWSSKSEVVLAAVRAQNTDFKLTVPDTGSLHADLLALMDLIADGFQRARVQNLMGLLTERLGGISMADYFAKFSRRNHLTVIVQGMFAKARARGELKEKPIPDNLYDLPVLLLIDLVFGGKEEVTVDRLHDLVDQVLMPVYAQFMRTNKQGQN